MKILLTGSVAFDYLMTFPGFFKEHILPDHLESISLSFLVDSMQRLRGGVAPNISYTMALLGQRPCLWAAVGIDFAEYRTWLEARGVDTSGAIEIPGVYTASFFVTTDNVNAQLASFYPGAMAHASKLSLHKLEDNRPDLVVISPNDPEAMKLYVQECQEMGLPYIYDPSQQIVRLTAEDLKQGIRGALALFVNDYEFALIEKAVGWSAQDILEMDPCQFIVITRGEKGVTIASASEVIEIPVVPPQRIIDPTGVGDAFRGGFLSGYSHQFDLLTCGRMGVLAATYCIENRGPQGHSFAAGEFVQRYRKYYDDQGKLAVLEGNFPNY